MKNKRSVKNNENRELKISKFRLVIKKKSHKIKQSSKIWLERQLKDSYVHQSKIEGYRSRSAYKLIEINQKYNFLKKNKKIIDLGCSPGSWSQVASKESKASHDKISIVGIDYLDTIPVPGAKFLKMDFLNDESQKKLLEKLKDKPDIIISDMAPPTIGHQMTDYFRTFHLCNQAANFAIMNLKYGGHFLTKIFQGNENRELFLKLKKKFKIVRYIKPNSSRKESNEMYLLSYKFTG